MITKLNANVILDIKSLLWLFFFKKFAIYFEWYSKSFKMGTCWAVSVNVISNENKEHYIFWKHCFFFLNNFFEKKKTKKTLKFLDYLNHFDIDHFPYFFLQKVCTTKIIQSKKADLNIYIYIYISTIPVKCQPKIEIAKI